MPLDTAPDAENDGTITQPKLVKHLKTPKIGIQLSKHHTA